MVGISPYSHESRSCRLEGNLGSKNGQKENGFKAYNVVQYKKTGFRDQKGIKCHKVGIKAQ